MKFLLFQTSSPILIFLVLTNIISAQENRLRAFEHLTGKTWYAEGKWGDGTLFKQETTFEFSLDSTIVIAKSKGFTDKEQTKFGLRNHGIRQFDPKSKKTKFWEFDVFGGLTKGEVEFEGDNIFYSYTYGKSIVTDGWIKVNDTTYQFIVGFYQDKKWVQKYLETHFLLKQN